MIQGLHHVAFVVESVDSGMDFADRAFGIKPVSRRKFEDQGIDLAIYQLGDTYFELTAPIGDDSALAKFLREKGPGIHHVAFGVPDISEAVATLVEREVRILGLGPTVGKSGWTVVNLDSQPHLGIAIQLVQKVQGIG